MYIYIIFFNGGGTTIWVQDRRYIVIGRCEPDGMVRIEGLDRFLTSIQRRIKHVKRSFFNDFWCREFWTWTDLVRLTVVKWLRLMLHPQEVTVACTTCNRSFHRLTVVVIHALALTTINFARLRYNVHALALTLRGRAELIVVSVRSMDDYYCRPMKWSITCGAGNCNFLWV